MEALIITVLVVLILVAILPFMAVIIASRSNKKANDLTARVAELEALVRKLRDGAESEKRTKVQVERAEEAEVPAEEEAKPEFEFIPSSPEPVVRNAREEKPVELAEETVAPEPLKEAQPIQVHRESEKTKEPKPTAKPKPKPQPLRSDVVEEESIEMRLGTYWFVRIGVMLMLTGAGILAYYKKQFIFDLSPVAKVTGLYLLSALMGGVGYWLQSAKERFKNYGQVLVAGGVAGVYFTTYAAHIFEPVRVIPDATVALILLLGWGGGIVFLADRLKSETLGLFAIGASYYATFVPLLHGAPIAGALVLGSNLVLAGAAVVLMLRHGWLKVPLLAMAASYGGVLLWLERASVGGEFVMTVVFTSLLWFVFTLAVFMSSKHAANLFSDRHRSAFLTTNNSALFGLLTREILQVSQDQFWVLAVAFGSVLILCSLAARRWLASFPLCRQSFLTQGLALGALGLITSQLAGGLKGPIFAAESIILLVLAILRGDRVVKVGAIAAAVLAVFYGLEDIGLLNGQVVALMLLVNAWICHRWVEPGEKVLLRRMVGFFTATGLTVSMAAILYLPIADQPLWLAAILVGVTLLCSVSFQLLRVREFVVLGQAFSAAAITFGLDPASRLDEFSWPMIAFMAAMLAMVHWWQLVRQSWMRLSPDWEIGARIALVAEAIYAFSGIVFALLWIHSGIGTMDEWMVLGSLYAIGFAVYGILTRSHFIALFGQVFVLVAGLVMVQLLLNGQGDEIESLVPILTFAVAIPVLPRLLAKILLPMFDDPEVFGARVATAYRAVTAGLALIWIYRFVPDQSLLLLTTVLGGLLLVLGAGKASRDWRWIGIAYLLVGGGRLAFELAESDAYWLSLLAIVGGLVALQVAKRRFSFAVAAPIHQRLIASGCVALFFWITIKVDELVPGAGSSGLNSIVWAILAVAFFGAGLGVQERSYRLAGLWTLAVAALSLVPIIWEMSTGVKITSFFVIGLVFVGLGYVYNRNKEQIRKLL